MLGGGENYVVHIFAHSLHIFLDGRLKSESHDDYLSQSSNEAKKQKRGKRGKGQAGSKARYSTRITPQQTVEIFPEDLL